MASTGPIAALPFSIPPGPCQRKTCRRYLYEALGMEPWLGSETDSGPSRPVGDHFFQLTVKGLSRELGYVGSYGEVLDWTTQIYDSHPAHAA